MSIFTKGNFITLLRSGEEYFPALEAAIHHAKHEIYIETYIYQMDEIGLRIGDALMSAARRGVAVYLLLDGFGCQSLAKSYIKQLTTAGVQVMIYREKTSPWTLQKNRLRRLHRKMVVVDRKTGFVGGINIIDDYDVPKDATPRLDYAVKVEGTIVSNMYHAMHKLWRRMAWLQMRSTPKKIDETNISNTRHMRKRVVSKQPWCCETTSCIDEILKKLICQRSPKQKPKLLSPMLTFCLAGVFVRPC